MNKQSVIVILLLGIIGVAAWSLRPQGKEQQMQQKNDTMTTQQVTPSDTKKKTYTFDEVAAHNNESSCWMAIDGKVYDVTDFIANHPGGKAILNGCGKDATTLFHERPTSGKGPHPQQAVETLPGYYIGDVEG